MNLGWFYILFTIFRIIIDQSVLNFLMISLENWRFGMQGEYRRWCRYVDNGCCIGMKMHESVEEPEKYLTESGIEKFL